MLCSASCDGTHQIFEFIYLFLYRLLCELCLFFSANASAAIISTNINFIFILNMIDFKDWKENVLIALGCMDLDLAQRNDQLPSLTTDSSAEARKEFKRWDCSDRMNLTIIKRVIPKTLRGTISGEITTAKEFLNDIEKCFVKKKKKTTIRLKQTLF